VGLLDGLPLALDQAGAYIEETACTIANYVGAYRSHQSFLLNRRGSPALDHPDSVVTTFSLSFEQVQQVSPLAAELLQSFTFLAPDAIPDELLLKGAKELALSQDIVSGTLLFDEAIATLQRFSLIRQKQFEKALRALDQSHDSLAKIRVYPTLVLKNMITRLEIYRAMGAIQQAQETYSCLTEMRKISELGYLVDEYFSSSPLLCPSGENA
jgi:hypothetical protein